MTVDLFIAERFSLPCPEWVNDENDHMNVLTVVGQSQADLNG